MGRLLTPADDLSWVARAESRLADDPTGALADVEQALRVNSFSVPGLQLKAHLLGERLNASPSEIESILASKKKLWGVVKDELNTVAETYGKDKRRTRMGSSEDEVDFDPEAYIVRENTNVVLTRDGWIKRVGRLETVEKTRVREGD